MGETIDHTLSPGCRTLLVPPGSTLDILTHAKTAFERDVLPFFLSRSRWFPERSEVDISTEVIGFAPLSSESAMRPCLVLFTARGRGSSGLYSIPVRIVWDEFEPQAANSKTIAKLQQDSKHGTLIDAAAEPAFIRRLIADLRRASILRHGDREVRFNPTSRLQHIDNRPIENVRSVDGEQSNSTSLVDNRYVVKIYRRLEDGVSPEVEVGRFLTDVANFANTPALLGSVDVTRGETTSAVAVIHEFVENRGDAWTVLAAALDRVMETRSSAASEPAGAAETELGACQKLIAALGTRLAQMHAALARHDEFADFRPVPVSADHRRHWIDDILVRAGRVFDRLTGEPFDQATVALTQALLAHRGALRSTLEALLAPATNLLNIRHHGDFHLGQVLVVNDDVFIIDFEGEPRRSLAERRMKAPAARDVAGLIRSIDYAAGAALQRAVIPRHDDPQEIPRRLEQWRDESVETFIISYFAAMKDARLWPTPENEIRQLLRFFLIEKAFYEIEYEIGHRPEWLTLPLSGALRAFGA